MLVIFMYTCIYSEKPIHIYKKKNCGYMVFLYNFSYAFIFKSEKTLRKYL